MKKKLQIHVHVYFTAAVHSIHGAVKNKILVCLSIALDETSIVALWQRNVSDGCHISNLQVLVLFGNIRES